MFKSHVESKRPEPLHLQHQHLLCWKSVIAGVFISIMSYMILTALGAGVVGFTAENMIENQRDGASALATASGLWLGLSAVISLFMGSYFALRIAKFVTNKIGAAHGFVIASIFFILMMIQVGSGAMGLTRGVGHLVEGIGMGASNVAANPALQDTINRSLGSTTLKSSPSEVAQGLAARLLSGDTQSAKDYYAYQTNQAPADVDAKVTQLKADFDQTVRLAGQKTATAVGDAGWSLFVTFIVGLLAALIGGRTGAHANVDRPLSLETPVETRRTAGLAPTFANERGSALPYLVGWMLGVPVSILFLIAMLRTVF